MGTIAKVTAGGSTHLVASTAYATCPTAANTVAKVATIQDSQAFTLIDGVTVHVYFTYSNTAANPTLNINSTGALPIYKYGTTVPGTAATTSWQAGSVVSFTYNKNGKSTGCWTMNDHLDDTNTQTVSGVKGDSESSYRTGNVNITAANVGAAASSHTHGNIQNGGTLQTTDVAIASGDKLVVTDSSDSSKIARTSASFDGSTATKCLTQKGTFESFTNNAGTITGVKTTAGAHTTINKTSGAAEFNVPTKTSHLTNDSNFVVGSSTSEGYLALLTAANTVGNGPKIIPFRKITTITGPTSLSYTGVSFTIPSGYFAILSVRARFGTSQPDQVAVCSSSTALGDYQVISISESGNTSFCYYNAESSTATFYVWAKYYVTGSNRIDIEGIYLTNLGTFVDTI